MGCDLCKPSRRPPGPPPPPALESLAPINPISTTPIPAQKRKLPVNFSSKYELGDAIGMGTFATVYNCTDLRTGEKFAVKVVDKSKLDAETEHAFLEEAHMLQSFDNPHIIHYRDFLEDDETYFLVEEFADGGELFDRIAEKHVYNEKDARDLVRTLLQAVQYYHSMHVVHRDLKPENILLSHKGDDIDIKLADFGFATHCEGNEIERGCGTLDYVAPEILFHKKYGKPIDMWSVGAITYVLLCGHPPFFGETVDEEKEKIKAGKYEFDYGSWSTISEEAKDLVRHLLIVDPEARFTAEQALAHPWIIGDSSDLMKRSLHGTNLNDSMRNSSHGSSRQFIDSVIFDKLNRSLHGITGLISKSFHQDDLNEPLDGEHR